MSQPQSIIFVLWDNHFDETIATLFITGLRKVGRHVKVVGLSGPQGRGASGLSLVADMTLSRALSLVEWVSHIIIPCDAVGLRRLDSDPHVVAFLERAGEGATQLVLLGEEIPVSGVLQSFQVHAPILIHPEHLNLPVLIEEFSKHV